MLEKEYLRLKREFIKVNGLSSDNIYNYLNENQINVIRKYYEVYTKYLFNRLMGSLRLEVSESKAKKLVELKGTGNWEFAGMVDMLKKGIATCELGHSIRYVYSAKNTSNDKVLHFGSHCVGDFFDMDEKGVSALIRVKEVMFNELKDMVSIIEQKLFESHYKYDCGELGIIYRNLGINGIEKMLGMGSLMPIVYDFLRYDLPLPKSLLDELYRNNKTDLIKLLGDSNFLGIEEEKIEKLKKSELTLISEMFKSSEKDIKERILLSKDSKYETDFYNFATIEDLNVAASIWINREDRLNKVYSYFDKMGICKDWVRIYRYMIEKGYKREIPDLYRGVEILVLFEPNISINSGYTMPKKYDYKGYVLHQNCYDNFDSLIDYMATREFLMALKELTSLIEKEEKEAERIKKEREDMMNYLQSNLANEKYAHVPGVNGIIDIVLLKKKSYDSMTENQRRYVESVYKAMLNLDNPKGRKGVPLEDDETVNRHYKLIEKPEILAKIQRLQSEVSDKLSDFTLNVIENIMKYKNVTDKQILCINRAYSELILGEKEEVKDMTLNTKKSENQKWSLADRVDVREKIESLQKMPYYSDIPSGIRNILENVLKYKTVSEKQIETIEKTYDRYFKK